MKLDFNSGFTILNSWELLDAFDKHLTQGKYPMLAFDTETNGLKFFRNVVIGLSISTDEHSGIYIPFLNWEPDLNSKKTKKIKKVEYEVYTDGQFRCQWTDKTYHEKVTPEEYRPPQKIINYVKKWLKDKKLLMHNAPFDCNMVMYNHEMDLSLDLYCDTRLLKHFVDEYTRSGLKETAKLWSKELGFDAEEDATREQKEMGDSVIRNGGTYNEKNKDVWRGDGETVALYACKDTALTFGLYRVGMQKMKKEYGAKGVDLFYNKEIMPLCREVVIPMQFGGMKISVEHFESLAKELRILIDQFEDSAIRKMGDLLKDFTKGKGIESISEKRILEKIIDMEALDYPTMMKKGQSVESLSKPAVKQAFEKNPHWLWGYILGQDEIKYSPEKMTEIKNSLYHEVEGRRYHFNVNSDYHLRWLLFDKLGNDKKSVPQTDSATKENPIPSCSAEVLEEHFKLKYNFIEDVMMFRRLSDLLGNYVEKATTLHNKGWLHMDMDQAGTTSGRFSCRGGFNLQTLPKAENLSICPKCESKKVEVKMKGTVLGSIHCQNCKTVTKNIICYSVIKEGFVAPKGYKIVNADYSSLEPRCFAFMSGDEKLKEIYKKDLDLYAKIYCDIEDPEGKYSPDPKAENFLKKKNPALRDMVKPVVLGIPYGARGPQVANLMGFKKTVENRKTKAKKEVLDVDRGSAWREKYLNTYADLNKYMEECDLFASTKGYVETLMGRRRHFKFAPIIQNLLNSRHINKEDFLDMRRSDLEVSKLDLGDGLDTEDLKWFAEESGLQMFNIIEKGLWAYVRGLYKNELDNAKNVRIQGLAAHICNRGMLDTTRHFRDSNVDGYVCLQVHDEITSYVREDQSELGSDLQRLGMEKNEFAKIVDIPMVADPIICENLKASK